MNSFIARASTVVVAGKKTSYRWSAGSYSIKSGDKNFVLTRNNLFTIEDVGDNKYKVTNPEGVSIRVSEKTKKQFVSQSRPK